LQQNKLFCEKLNIGDTLRITSCLLVILACISFFAPCAVFAADLAGTASLSGYVKDSVTGQPIFDARISLKCGPDKLKTTSNFQGYYQFSEILIYSKNGDLLEFAEIKISAQQYISIIDFKDLLPDQSYTMDFNLHTRFTYPIVRGKVFDTSTLSGIPEAVVTANSDNNVFTTVADLNGNYVLRIESKNPQEYSIIAKADEYYESSPQIIKVFPYDTYNIDFPLDIMALGVSVSPDSWQIGSIGPNSVATMQLGQQITVTNTGNDNLTYSLMLISPEGWTASQTAVAAEQYILNVCFSSEIETISWNDENHSLLEILQRCSEIKFAGDQNGVDIIPGQQRTLWMQFKAPLSTIIENEQVIEVIINAEMP